MLESSPTVVDRFKKACSNPPLGAEEDRNGEMLGLWSLSLIASDESVELASGVGVRWWVLCTVLLLLSDGISIVSSYRLLEKNALRDAVMGVVGVLGSIREGGGLEFSTISLESGWYGSLATLGMLSGPKLMGGRLKGWRFFLCDGVVGFSTSAPIGRLKGLFLALGFLWILEDSMCTGVDMLAAELLCILLVSRLLSPDFFLSITAISAGDPLGDS
jgi:hypothetical protein